MLDLKENSVKEKLQQVQQKKQQQDCVKNKKLT